MVDDCNHHILRSEVIFKCALFMHFLIHLCVCVSADMTCCPWTQVAAAIKAFCFVSHLMVWCWSSLHFFGSWNGFQNVSVLSGHGLGLPFDSSHNSANAFRHLVWLVSYIQFTAGWLSQNEFCLNLQADFPWCISGLHITETTLILRVFMLRMRIFSLCIVNLLLKQINDSDAESNASKL